MKLIAIYCVGFDRLRLLNNEVLIPQKQEAVFPSFSIQKVQRISSNHSAKLKQRQIILRMLLPVNKSNLSNVFIQDLTQSYQISKQLKQYTAQN